MEWISIKNRLPKDGQKVIIWQENLSDPKCSRHHCAIFFEGKDFSFFDIYPRAFDIIYKSEKDFKNYDLEGDKCELTHWLPLPKRPKTD